MWGPSSATISSLHNSFLSPEIEINPLKMACDSHCGGVVKMVAHVIFSPYGKHFVDVQLHIFLPVYSQSVWLESTSTTGSAFLRESFVIGVH